MTDESKIEILDLPTENKSLVDDKTIEQNKAFADSLNAKMTASKLNDELKEAIRQNNFKAVVKIEAEQEMQTNEAAENSHNIDDSVQKDIVAVKEGDEKMTTATEGKGVSLRLGIIGAGAAGSRLSEVFYKYGYDAVCINTAAQDLSSIDMDEGNKFLIEGLGGAGKNLDIGLSAFESKEEEIKAFIESKLGDAEVLVLCSSGGGGTGSSGIVFLAKMLASAGKPIVVLFVLPGSFDDSQSKSNSITTLDRLANLVSSNVINSLVLVDNSNIEATFSNLSQAEFFKTANKKTVEPLHMFNSLSSAPTEFEVLDAMDFSHTLIESSGCTVFGTIIVDKDIYESNELGLSSSVLSGFEGGLLASGFDYTSASNVGILISARNEVLQSIPYQNIAYLFKVVSDEFKAAKTFKGIYAIPSSTNSDDITVRFMISGLNLPKDRVDNLRSDVEKNNELIEAKKKNVNLSVGLNKDKNKSTIDANLDRLKKMNGGLGKLLSGSGGPKKIERKR